MGRACIRTFSWRDEQYLDFPILTSQVLNDAPIEMTSYLVLQTGDQLNRAAPSCHSGSIDCLASSFIDQIECLALESFADHRTVRTVRALTERAYGRRPRIGGEGTIWIVVQVIVVFDLARIRYGRIILAAAHHLLERGIVHRRCTRGDRWPVFGQSRIVSLREGRFNGRGVSYTAWLSIWRRRHTDIG